MSEQNLQVTWQLTGDSITLIERLGLDGEEEDVSLIIHAGQETLQEAQTRGAEMVLIRDPRAAPDPLIAFAAVDVFDEAEIFDTRGPCLVVGPAFIAEFGAELEASCKVFDVRVVMSGKMDTLLADRAGLLAMGRPDVDLKALVPLQTIKTRIERQDLRGAKFDLAPWPMTQYKLERDRNPTLRIHAREGTFTRRPEG